MRAAGPMLAVALAGSVSAAGAGFAAPAAQASNGSIAAVRKVLSEQQEAWNRGDLATFMDHYWKSDSLTFYSGGAVQKGWRATYDRYVRRYQSEGQEMGRLDFELHEVVLLGSDRALAKGAWFLKRSNDAPHGLFTLILRRFPAGRWKIVHDHTSAAE